MRRLLALWWLSCVCACGDTGREYVELALSARGADARPLEISGARVMLTRAEVAFGPAYYCASANASAELCSVAIAELRTPVLISALEPAIKSAGTLAATTGTILSAVFDYGVSWLLTENEPRASEVAPSGHSALLEGTLERAERRLHFVARIDVKPMQRGQLAVNDQPTRHVIAGGGEALTVAVDPNRWIDRLEVDALFALDVDGDGEIEIAPGTTSYESILQGMVNRAPATFSWEPVTP